MRHATQPNDTRGGATAISAGIYLCAAAVSLHFAQSHASALSPVEELAQAMRTVAAAQTYSWGRVGTPARLSEAEVAARKLHQDASGAELVKGLASASPEGQLYLLCILARNDRALFGQALQQLPGIATAEISALSGDVMQRVKAQNLLAQIQRHACDPLGHR